ncbi:GAF domain-containing protein [candidate division WOR-3 bacterium]|uniref:GAF domain-containing protein n=1 Tax=candidate division WOR-3 bacterium TaxID=2052148 RepID=A0A9D5QCE8_UNCW3|nr:GAF domain-containing protein [candidate division WOR-3 bacterium]MBD3364603.1 GAF domain-containing protein [candidate division WOR-3 bacterium]
MSNEKSYKYPSAVTAIGAEELRRLVEVTGKLLSTIDFDRLLDVILESAKSLTRSEASSLLLLDEKVGKLRFAVATGEAKDSLASLYVPLGEESIAGYVALHGKPLVVNDVKKDGRWYSGIDEATSFHTRSILAVPLTLEDKTVGVIEVLNKKKGAEFLEEDIGLLEILANQAALVLRNAQEYLDLAASKRVIEAAQALRYKIVGRNRKLLKAVDLAKRVAGSNTTVMITGESGTGKELLARYIHLQSPRKDGPFVVVNCAAIPTTLIESELFGYEKGAFTGAVSRKEGKFEQAHKGTLFLDEIGDLGLETQVKLLRFFEDKEFERLGGKERINVDVRVITATNQDLPSMIADKKFREDLFYRINVFPIELVPLRERTDDIPLLASHFVQVFNAETTKGIEKVDKEALVKLAGYDWPGNIRELRNVVERAFVLASEDIITAEDIVIGKGPGTEQKEGLYEEKPWMDAVHNFKRSYLIHTLKKTRGNHKKAAEMLGIQPSYLSRLKKELGLEEF